MKQLIIQVLVDTNYDNLINSVTTLFKFAPEIFKNFRAEIDIMDDEENIIGTKFASKHTWAGWPVIG